MFVIIILNTLPTVTLTDPANNNVTTNRTQKFTWSGSDDDALIYQINITLYALSFCTDSARTDSGISTEYHISSPYVNCLSDNNNYYNWTVRASDDAGSTYGAWATPRKIEYQAFVLATLINDTVSFGSLTMDSSENTTDNNPWSFLIQNEGNCFLNISINATDLWNSIINPSLYYRYKIDNKLGEEGSFDWAQSNSKF